MYTFVDNVYFCHEDGYSCLFDDKTVMMKIVTPLNIHRTFSVV